MTPILFIDLDNTIYPESMGVDQLMVARIQEYCVKVLGISPEEARQLHKKYFHDYGLAIRGLIKHHNINPSEYDLFVDGGLPLDGLIVQDEPLRQMLLALPPWPRYIFTNAGRRHAERVIRLLGLESVCPSERIICCNYEDPNFVCKPDESAFIRAMKIAGVQNSFQCALIDDNVSNVTAALRMGWKSVLVREIPRPSDPKPEAIPTIRTIHELPSVLEEISRHLNCSLEDMRMDSLLVGALSPAVPLAINGSGTMSTIEEDRDAN